MPVFNTVINFNNNETKTWYKILNLSITLPKSNNIEKAPPYYTTSRLWLLSRMPKNNFLSSTQVCCKKFILWYNKIYSDVRDIINVVSKKKPKKPCKNNLDSSRRENDATSLVAQHIAIEKEPTYSCKDPKEKDFEKSIQGPNSGRFRIDFLPYIKIRSK